MPKLSRWQRDHSACQKTITRQRAEIERLRERIAALEADAGKDSDTVGATVTLYGG